jgi:CRISPR-associated endonuclease Cas3-HD
MSELYAHTPNDKGEWHYLKDHLQKVAEIAKSFAEKFGAGDMAHWIGLWHDLGKCDPRFQSYLEACFNGKGHDKVQHAVGGAALMFAYSLETQQNDRWMNLMLPLAGHHAGLHAAGELALKLKDYVETNRELLQKLYEYSKHLPSLKSLDLIAQAEHGRELILAVQRSLRSRLFPSLKAVQKQEKWKSLQGMIPHRLNAPIAIIWPHGSAQSVFMKMPDGFVMIVLRITNVAKI